MPVFKPFGSSHKCAKINRPCKSSIRNIEWGKHFEADGYKNIIGKMLSSTQVKTSVIISIAINNYVTYQRLQNCVSITICANPWQYQNSQTIHKPKGNSAPTMNLSEQHRLTTKYPKEQPVPSNNRWGWLPNTSDGDNMSLY